MSQSVLTKPAIDEEARLPRRDWILLPLVAIFTMAFMTAASEVVARVVWPAQGDACFVENGPDGVYLRPNCKSRTKVAEGPWVDNVYNECGYRTLEPCGPKPQGTIRVAVLGASDSFGYDVPYDSSYTAVTGEMLTGECRRHIEFQNLGVPLMSLSQVYRRTGQALALKPDILLLSLNPFDLGKFDRFDPDANPTAPAASENGGGRDWIRNNIAIPLKSSRAFLMLQHFMYQDPETYVKLYLLYGDAAGYARTPFSPMWQKRLSNLDVMLRDMSEKAHAASVPMVLLVGPSVFQGAMVNALPRPGVDPQALPKEIARIASSHGITMVNPLPGFAGQPDVMDMFYAVDGHTAPRGQAVIANELNRTLLSSNLPALEGCSLK